MQRVLITGGAGFLGINLVRYLLERGYAVRSLDIAPFDYPEQTRIEAHTGDIRDQSAVMRAMEGVDFVIHTAAALPLYKPADIFSTDIDGTRNVLQAAAARQVARFIHISTTAVYGIPDHHPLLETDPMQGVGPYGEAKVKAEELCLAYRAKGMCVPIIRPSPLLGPSAWASSPCSTTGPRTARTSHCPAAARIATNCSMSKTSARPFIAV